MDAIELHPHFTFDCNNCGAENFIRVSQGEMAVPPEAFDSEEDYLAVSQGSGDLRVLVTVAPKFVTCGQCNEKFSADLCGGLGRYVE